MSLVDPKKGAISLMALDIPASQTPDGLSQSFFGSRNRKIENITVLGAGSWGTALAMAFARAGLPVKLWGRNAEHIEDMKKDGKNAKYLPGVPLPDGILPTNDILDAVRGSDAIFVVTPSKAFKHVAREIATSIRPGTPVISCAKGLDPHTNGLLTTRIKREIPQSVPMVLTGPSFASEVANEQPTSVVLAGPTQLADALTEVLATPNFQLITETDLVGVQVGGIMKNVIAIACGMADGLGHGSNTRASILARGLAEAGTLAAALGGNPVTLLGVAGAGDLALTCTDAQSRNYSFGRALADPEMTLSANTFEGAMSVSKVCQLMKALELDAEIAPAVEKAITGDITPAELIDQLFACAMSETHAELQLTA